MRGPSKDKRKTARARDERDLFAAFSELASAREAAQFLRDLATPAEIEAFAERWRIARMLSTGAYSYRDIAGATGASTTTIGRVARFLRDENYGGYRLILERLGEDNEDGVSHE